MPSTGKLLIALIFVHILKRKICAGNSNMTIKTIEFIQSFDKTPKSEASKDGVGFKETTEITICFRLMPRYIQDNGVIHTGQIYFKIKKELNVARLKYFPIKGTSSDSSPHKYSRLIPLCQSITPGKWVSICIGIKNSSKMQNITVVQNGKTCLNRNYRDGNFGLIRLREKLSLQDM